MKKIKIEKNYSIILLLAIVLFSCKNSTHSNKQDETSNTEETQSITRPSVSDSAARKLLGKQDFTVAKLMQGVREFHEQMDKGAKMTPVVEANLTDLLNTARTAKDAMTEDVTAKLNEDDYKLYQRSVERFKSKETELEGMKQIK